MAEVLPDPPVRPTLPTPLPPAPSTLHPPCSHHTYSHLMCLRVYSLPSDVSSVEQGLGSGTVPSPQEVLSKCFQNEEININFGKPGSALTQKPSTDELGRDGDSVTGSVPEGRMGRSRESGLLPELSSLISRKPAPADSTSHALPKTTIQRRGGGSSGNNTLVTNVYGALTACQALC